MTRTVRQSHPVRRCLIFLTPRSSGQLIGQIEGRANGGFSAAWTMPPIALMRCHRWRLYFDKQKKSCGYQVPCPDRFTFAHGSMYPYLTPKQLKPSARHRCEPGMAGLPPSGICLRRQPPSWTASRSISMARMTSASSTAVIWQESADMLLTGSPEMEITELTMDGFVNATMQVDPKRLLQQAGSLASLLQGRLTGADRQRPIAVEELFRSRPDSTLLAQAADWADDTPITARYRVFNVDIIGMSQKEIRALLRQVSANSAEE